MRTVVLSMMVFPDGYVEATRGDISWHVWNKEMDGYMMDLSFCGVKPFDCGNILLIYEPSK